MDVGRLGSGILDWELMLNVSSTPTGATTTSPLRVLFVEQYYFPEGWGGAELPRDITIALREEGFNVDVICGSDPYVEPDPSETTPNPIDAGVFVSRVPRLIKGDVKRRRLLRQLLFYLMLIPKLLLHRRPDLYMAQTNPPLAVVLMACVALLYRKPLLIVAQDLYPETLAAHGLLRRKSIVYFFLRSLFGFAYRSATSVIALGPVMRQRLLEKDISEGRIAIISNWATGPLDTINGTATPFRSAWRLDGQFVLLYSGNLGVGHEFDTLLKGVSLAWPQCPNLRVVFIGKGSRLSEVQKKVLQLNLSAIVQFRDLVPASQLPHSLALANIAVVTLRQGFEGLIVPSKFFGYMARGIPTLYIGPDSDISHVIKAANCGFVCANEDAAAVCSAIVNAYNDNVLLRRLSESASDGYARQFSRKTALDRYVHQVRQTVVQGRS
jgi:colanic acid biosynthesis glycosyl transferase WcaI